jgi:hypothetical protein
MMKFKTELKWVLIFFGASLLWMVLERAVGLHDTHIEKHATYTNIFAFVAIGVYVFALRDKRETDFNGYMSWKDGFISGTIISLGVMVLTPLSQIITAHIITPDYFANAIEYGVTHGLSTRSDAEAYFNLKNYLFISTISAPLMGIVTSAVVAFFLKKETT